MEPLVRFFGVQIAYALQSANVSRIFATLGADPHDLSYFWILPPLMGLIVQPIVGTASDKTWNRFGRRLPYLIAGAGIAVIVMCLLPNAGSFGLAVSSAIIIGLVALMLLDTSINMAMQPFKMLVGDMVNEKTERIGLLHPEFPVQRRFHRGLRIPVPPHLDRIPEHRRRRCNTGDRGVLFLLRCSHPVAVRGLFPCENKGMAATHLCRI